ncbi:hypothetical protein JVX90_00080 [Gordonia sp. PDNC005]|nr:hypothetical protein [Gordonia sp. PDNC005]QRY62710.1 hypothetical protein JVX90_00080 [Gordonia sp. PDNC005]
MSTTTVLPKLIGQWSACKGDKPHSPRCKRCRRGQATGTVRPATTQKKEK